MRGGVPAGEGDWFARNADRRNATAFINTNPAYFAAECASAIKEGRLVLATPTPPIEGRDADVERKVEAMAIAMYCADNGMDSDANSAHIHYWFRDPDEKDKGAVDEYRVMARAALQALGERG